MATVSTAPTLIVPNRAAEIRFTLTSGGNYIRVWCSVAPEGSELATKLQEQAAHRVLVYEGDGGQAAPWRTAFDRGGAYTLIAQEYVKGAAAYGGGYQDAPASAPSETKAGAESTLLLYVGQRLTLDLGVAPDTAQLVLWVWNDTIRRTTLAAQGEDSPSVTATSPTPRARLAMTQEAVSAAAAALVGQTSVTGTLSTLVPSVVSAIRAHMTSATVHSTPDTVNAPPAALSADPAQHLDDVVSTLISALRRHMDNEGDPSSGPPFGVGSAGFHSVVDRKNAPLVTGANGQASAYLALADLWRAYSAHRVSSVHAVPDAINTLPTLPLLLAVHVRFLEALASTSLAVPPGQSSLATQLIQVAGLSES